MGIHWHSYKTPKDHEFILQEVTVDSETRFPLEFSDECYITVYFCTFLWLTCLTHANLGMIWKISFPAEVSHKSGLSCQAVCHKQNKRYTGATTGSWYVNVSNKFPSLYKLLQYSCTYQESLGHFQKMDPSVCIH